MVKPVKRVVTFLNTMVFQSSLFHLLHARQFKRIDDDRSKERQRRNHATFTRQVRAVYGTVKEEHTKSL